MRARESDRLTGLPRHLIGEFETFGGCAMWRFMLVTFVFLGWGFYEMSGGADYRPAPNSIQARAVAEEAQPATRPARGAQDVVLASARGDVGVPTLSVTPRSAGRDDRRRVLAYAADLRIGPGKGYGRVARLDYDTEVVVLRDPGSGWVKLRVAGDGPVGWAVARLFGHVR